MRRSDRDEIAVIIGVLWFLACLILAGILMSNTLLYQPA